MLIQFHCLHLHQHGQQALTITFGRLQLGGQLLGQGHETAVKGSAGAQISALLTQQGLHIQLQIQDPQFAVLALGLNTNVQYPGPPFGSDLISPLRGSTVIQEGNASPVRLHARITLARYRLAIGNDEGEQAIVQPDVDDAHGHGIERLLLHLAEHHLTVGTDIDRDLGPNDGGAPATALFTTKAPDGTTTLYPPLSEVPQNRWHRVLHPAPPARRQRRGGRFHAIAIHPEGGSGIWPVDATRLFASGGASISS
ncbi:hypothetical protein MBH78_17520 [Oceanimonas sp. NS1]|nr:hypothetical protein [Oceanimonas sp. NS1]